jgi:hypothetical protein
MQPTQYTPRGCLPPPPPLQHSGRISTSVLVNGGESPDFLDKVARAILRVSEESPAQGPASLGSFRFTARYVAGCGRPDMAALSDLTWLCAVSDAARGSLSSPPPTMNR